MSKGNTKAQEMTSNISAESILITGESNWMQMLPLGMVVKRAASMLRRVCCSAGFTVLGGDWVDLSRS